MLSNSSAETSQRGGGALYCADFGLALAHASFRANGAARSRPGGAVSASHVRWLRLSDCHFQDSSAVDAGGAVSLRSSAAVADPDGVPGRQRQALAGAQEGAGAGAPPLQGLGGGGGRALRSHAQGLAAPAPGVLLFIEDSTFSNSSAAAGGALALQDCSGHVQVRGGLRGLSGPTKSCLSCSMT